MKFQFFALFLLPVYLFSQYDLVDPGYYPDSKKEDFVYEFCENNPSYIGGEKEMKLFFETNINYDSLNLEKSGVLYVTFVVRKDSTITDAKIAKGISDKANAEALRVVSIMPKWIPGKQKGEPISVKYTIPIKFTKPGSNGGYAVPPPPPPLNKIDSIKTSGDDMGGTLYSDSSHPVVLDFDETNPEYPGGFQALKLFIEQNIRYDSLSPGVKGTVYVQFIVKENGSLADVEIIKGLSEKVNKEALRIVSIMPDWIPGKIGDKVRDTSYTIPIKFSQQ